jgi:hypothetical protein
MSVDDKRLSKPQTTTMVARRRDKEAALLRNCARDAHAAGPNLHCGKDTVRLPCSMPPR